MSKVYEVTVHAPKNREYNACYRGTLAQLRKHYATYLAKVTHMPTRSIKQFQEAILYGVSAYGVHDFSVEVKF